jgi:serine/threonine protein kinase
MWIFILDLIIIKFYSFVLFFKENILLEDVNNLNSLKIADFGLSAQFGRSNMSKIMTKQCGTLIYMAPEQLDKKIYSKVINKLYIKIIIFMFDFIACRHL